MSVSRRVAIAFWITSFAFLFVGMATLSFEHTSGYITSVNNVHLESGGYPGGYRARVVSKGGSFAWHSAQYDFSYKGRPYHSGLLCFCIPVGFFNSLHAWTSVPVYVYPPYPNISVIRPGPDWFLIFALALAGLALWHLPNALRDLLQGKHWRA